MKKSLFLMTLLSLLAPAMASVTVDGSFSLSIQRGTADFSSLQDPDSLAFKALQFTSDDEGGTVTLSSDDGTALDLTGGTDTVGTNLYFDGTGTTTITGVKINNSTQMAANGTTKTYFAFVVASGKVVFDGVTGEDDAAVDLQQNLSVGTAWTNYNTAEGTAPAVLTIQNGSRITTSAYYNSVGANGSKGTIHVTGEGSELRTQQITLGAGTAGMTAAPSPSKDLKYYSKDGEALLYWYPKYLYGDTDYQELVPGKISESYGIINITHGGKMYVGEGNTERSNNKLQIFNGEVNVDGAGSQLVLGNNCYFTMDANYGTTVTGLKNSLNITNGGQVSVEEGCKLFAFTMGGLYNGNETQSSISVSGEGSSLDLDSTNSIVIGSENSGAGSKELSTITVSDGATATLSSGNQINFAPVATGEHTVRVSVESGGLLQLEATNDSYVGWNSTADFEFSATGTGSQLTYTTGGDILVNYTDTGTTEATIAAYDGATAQLIAGGEIIMGKNTHLVADGSGSLLETQGATTLKEGATASINQGGVWDSRGTVTIAAGAVPAVPAVSIGSTGTWNAWDTVTSRQVIDNDGTINIYKQMALTADTITGNGVTNLHIYDEAITSDPEAGTSNPILTLGSLTDGQTIKVVIDLNDSLLLLGKSYDFLKVGDSLQALEESQITTINGLNPDIDFANRSISFDGGQIGFDAHGWTSESGTLTGCTFDYWRSGDTTAGADGNTYTSQLTVEEQAKGITTADSGVVIAKGESGDTSYTTYSQHVEMGDHVAATVSLMKQAEDGSYDAVDSQGRVLLFNKAATFTGDSDADALIGFTESDVNEGKTVSLKGDGVAEGATAAVEAADIVLVTAKDVMMENLTMNVGQRLELKNEGSLTLSGAHVTIGGSDVEAKDFATFEVEELNEPIRLNKNDANLQLASQRSVIASGSTLIVDATEADASFEALKLKGGQGTLTVEEGAQIILKSDQGTATFGSTAEDAMHIIMENADLSGTGSAYNFSMEGGSLTVGNSPGVMTIGGNNEFTDTTWTFYFITDADWKLVNETTGKNGAFSQLKVDKGGATADHVTVNIAYQTKEGESSSANDLKAPLESGFSVKLINGAENITNIGSTVNAQTLPTLQDGLLWDTSTLFSDGVIRIINEVLADSTRIANTLVSAADTTAYFGRMARNHAQDARRDRANVWAGGFGTFLNHDDKGGRTGFEYNTEGYAIGADTRVTDNTVAGIAFGQSFGKHKPNRGNSFFTPGRIDQDGLLAGIYSSSIFPCPKVKEDQVVLDLYAAYGHYDNESRRNSLANGRVAEAEWCENTWSLGAVLTRRMQLENNAWLTPFVGIEYKYANMNDMTEHGSTDVRYTGASYQDLALSVGLGYSKSIALGATQSLTPYISAAYVGDAMRQDGKVTAYGQSGTWTDRSAAHGRHALQVNVGAYWKLDEEWGVRAGYTAEIREGADDHNVNVGVHYSF